MAIKLIRNFGLTHAIWRNRDLFIALVGLMIFVVFTFIFLALLLFYVTGEAQPEKFSLQLPVLSLLPSLLLIIFILAYLLSNQKPLELTCSEPATTTDYKNRTPLLETLCIANGMPTPDLYIVDNISINAIAWGRKPDERSEERRVGKECA